MKTCIRNLLLSVTLLGLAVPSPFFGIARAQTPLPLYEPFAYGENENLGATGSSGTNWVYGNSVSSSCARIRSEAALTYPGLPIDVNAPARGLRSNNNGKNRGYLIAPQTGTTYASFLINLQTNVTGNRVFFALSASTSGTGPTVNAGVWLDSIGRLLISKNSSTTPANVATYPLVASNTYLVVLRYKVNPGALDEVALWLNPTSLGTNVSVPPPTLTTTNNNNVAGINSIAYMAPSSTPVPLFFMDEIRVGTNWADVTPNACSPGAIFNVTGGGTACAGTGFPIGLSGSEAGVDYWLLTNGVVTGQVLPGTGSSLDFGNQSVSGIYTVFGSNTTTSCTYWMTGTATIANLASPVIVADPMAASVASGSVAAFSVGATGDGLTYQWRKNGVTLSDSGNISGVNTPNLVISPVGAGDVASATDGYDVVVSGTCAPLQTSARVGLAIRTPADLTWYGDGVSDKWDLGTSLDWNNGASAFYNGDRVTFTDTTIGFTNWMVNLASSYLAPGLVNVAAGNYYTFGGSGSLTGPGALVVGGMFGYLTNATVNSYGGGTIISNSAYLIVQKTGGLGSGPVTLAGGTLVIGAAINLSNAITVTADSTIAAGRITPLLYGPLTGTSGSLAFYGPTANFTPRFYAGFTFNRPVSIDVNVLLQLYNDATTPQIFNGVISGAGRLERRPVSPAGSTILNAANTYSGHTLLRGGYIGFGLNTVASVPPTVDSGPIGTGNLILDDSGGDDRGLFASGGPRTIANPITMFYGTNDVTFGLIGTNDLTLSGDASLSGSTIVVRADNAGRSIFSGAINSTGGGLIKTGTNSLTLAGTNTYSGPTTVGNGTLLVNGQIDLGGVTVTNGTLAGTGTILGPVTVQSGGALAPGAEGIGTLTINNALTLQPGSTTRVEVNQAAHTSDLVQGLTTVTYGGTLAVNNLGGSLALGNSFTLFSATAHSGNFANITGSPGAGLGWSFANGVLTVVTGGPDLTRTNITYSVSGNQLTLAWPENHIGWYLQAQTNTLSVGLVANPASWYTYPNSSTTNRVIVPVDATKGTVFFRLVYTNAP